MAPITLGFVLATFVVFSAAKGFAEVIGQTAFAKSSRVLARVKDELDSVAAR